MAILHLVDIAKACMMFMICCLLICILTLMWFGCPGRAEDILFGVPGIQAAARR